MKTSIDETNLVGWEPRDPHEGEFFDPEPDSWHTKTRSIGPPQIALGRLGTRRFRLLKRFGYYDAELKQAFVVPRDLEDFEANLSSAPTLVSWIAPVLGSHFNPIVLHDGLVEPEIYDPNNPGQGNGYFGQKVSREQADRIVRDAMVYEGTGVVRRWLMWAGMMIGTILSPEGIGSRKWYFKGLFVVTFLLILAFGGYSTFEVFGSADRLPWLGAEHWLGRLAAGIAVAVVSPLALAVLWGKKRFKFGAIFGVGLAVLLPAFAVTAALTALYFAAEYGLKKLGLTQDDDMSVPASAFRGLAPATEG